MFYLIGFEFRQAKVQQEAGLTADDDAVPPGEPGSREEADSRSIYVGNVDYVCTPEELQIHFQVYLHLAVCSVSFPT